MPGGPYRVVREIFGFPIDAVVQHDEHDVAWLCIEVADLTPAIIAELVKQGVLKPFSPDGPASPDRVRPRRARLAPSHLRRVK